MEYCTFQYNQKLATDGGIVMHMSGLKGPDTTSLLVGD